MACGEKKAIDFSSLFVQFCVERKQTGKKS
jgi:hypothetical protein